MTTCAKDIHETDPTYPEMLRDVSGRPKTLQVMGRWPLAPLPAFGIVGTRRPTPYGLKMARQIAYDLVEAGAMVISGMASGIDAAAHEAALEAGGATVGILGHGLKWEYPHENKRLYAAMKEKGTLISEFPYEAHPLPAYFPQRNRIISGLSKGVVVIEAGKPSGALITARFAGEQGRDVFAVPGSVYNVKAVGCHALIKEGAKLVETADDVLAEYGELWRTPGVTRQPLMNVQNLTPVEEKLYQTLSLTPVTMDELLQATGFSVDQLAATLLSLELKNLISAHTGQRYATKN